MQCEKGSLFLGGFIGGAGGCYSGFGEKQAMPLGGVFVLLCTASSKVHPAEVISVLYPVAGGQTTGSAGDGGSGLVGRAWKRQG